MAFFGDCVALAIMDAAGVDPLAKHLEIHKKIKPLSVNECWKGRRFKSDKYKEYEKLLLYTLPRGKVPKGKLSIYYEFGFSNLGADIDNPIKPLQDILQKKYKFNDSCVFECNVRKVKVKKGDEYFKVFINSVDSI